MVAPVDLGGEPHVCMRIMQPEPGGKMEASRRLTCPPRGREGILGPDQRKAGRCESEKKLRASTSVRVRSVVEKLRQAGTG